MFIVCSNMWFEGATNHAPMDRYGLLKYSREAADAFHDGVKMAANHNDPRALVIVALAS
jgi:hypothetical protein